MSVCSVFNPMKRDPSYRRQKNGNLLVIILLTSLLPQLQAGKTSVTTAFSETSEAYKRVMLPSGHYEPETYAFAKGDMLDQSGRDESLTQLSFREIGAVLAEALADADYVPTPNPEATDLLIVVNWGKTIPFGGSIGGMATDGIIDSMEGMQAAGGYEYPEGELSGLNTSLNPLENSMSGYYAGLLDQGLAMQQMEDDARDAANAYNAKLLGYHEAVRDARSRAAYITMLRDYHLQVIKEIEVPRYFVILQAYDFQEMWKHKERKLLWTTRFSIRAQGSRFDEKLKAMAMSASRVMGEDSKNLVRNLRPTRVEFGELEYLGVDP